jgi:choline kinase
MLREQSFVATASTASASTRTAPAAAPLTVSARRAAGYALTPEGFIGRIGANPPQRAGDAIGLGYVSAGDKKALMRGLAATANRDATERGIELAIEHDRMLVEPLDVSGLHAVDVDHPGDLDRANAFV